MDDLLNLLADIGKGCIAILLLILVGLFTSLVFPKRPDEDKTQRPKK